MLLAEVPLSRKGRDPTIPIKGKPAGNAADRSRVHGPSQGRLVDYGGGTVVLADMAGGMWPSERVRWVGGSWGFNAEGTQRRPRPWLFAGSEVVVEGDWFLIHFLHGNANSPVIQGGIRTLKPDDAEFFDAQPLGGDPNPIRHRSAAIDPKTGAVTGTIEVRALDGGNSLAVVVGGSSFGTGIRIVLDFDNGLIKLGQGAEIHPAGFGEKIAEALGTLAADLLTVAGAIPTAPPPGTTALQLELEVEPSLFYSSTVKVE